MSLSAEKKKIKIKFCIMFYIKSDWKFGMSTNLENVKTSKVIKKAGSFELLVPTKFDSCITKYFSL